jgi:hypothetical protein
MSARVERTATDDRGNRSDRDQRVNTGRIVLMTVGASAVKVNCISSREEREHRGNDRQVERGGDFSLANAVIAPRAIANPKGDGPVADTKLATAPLMRATYRDLG